MTSWLGLKWAAWKQSSSPADSRKPPSRMRTRKKAEPTTAMMVSSLQRAATKRNIAIPSVCSRNSITRKIKNLQHWHTNLKYE